MPFKSKSQQRFFFGAEAAGELPAGTAKRWADHTKDIRQLPERVKSSSEALAAIKAAMQGVPDSQLAIQLMQQQAQQAQQAPPPGPPQGDPNAGWDPQLGPMIGRATDQAAAPPPPPPVDPSMIAQAGNQAQTQMPKAAGLEEKLSSLLPSFAAFEALCKRAALTPQDIFQPNVPPPGPQDMAQQSPVLATQSLPQGPGGAPPLQPQQPMPPQAALQPQADGRMQGFANPMPGAPNPLGAGTLAYGGMRVPGMGKQGDFESRLAARAMSWPVASALIGGAFGGAEAPKGYGVQGMLRGGIRGLGRGLGGGLGLGLGALGGSALGGGQPLAVGAGAIGGGLAGAIGGDYLASSALGEAPWEKDEEPIGDKREKRAFRGRPGRMIDPSANMRALNAGPQLSKAPASAGAPSPFQANIDRNLAATRKAVGPQAQGPAYNPGQASFASPAYSGYGSNAGAPKATMGEPDFARNPAMGASPRVAQLSGGARTQGNAMAAQSQSGIQAGDRMAARAQQVRAPMNEMERQSIAANFGGMSFMQPPRMPRALAGIAPPLPTGGGPQSPVAAQPRPMPGPQAGINARPGGGMMPFGGRQQGIAAPRAASVGSLAQGTQPFRPGSTPAGNGGLSKMSEDERRMPHEGVYNGRRIRIQRGPVTQTNGKFSAMGRHKAAGLDDRLMHILARGGFVAAGAVPGAVLGGIAGDEAGQQAGDAAELGIGFSSGAAGALAGGAAGGMLGNALYDSATDKGRDAKTAAMRLARDPFRKPLATDRIVRSLARQYGFLSKARKKDEKDEKRYTLSECQQMCGDRDDDRDYPEQEKEAARRSTRRGVLSLGREAKSTGAEAPSIIGFPRGDAARGGGFFGGQPEARIESYEQSPAGSAPGAESPRGVLARIKSR